MLFVSVTSSFSSGTTPFTFCLIFFYSHPHGGSTSHFLRQKEDTCPSNWKANKNANWFAIMSQFC
jgi:hypothetical protein